MHYFGDELSARLPGNEYLSIRSSTRPLMLTANDGDDDHQLYASRVGRTCTGRESTVVRNDSRDHGPYRPRLTHA